jgi:hypothetical protein
MTTPDVESDLLAKLAALLPTDVIVAGADLNALAGPLRPAGRKGVHEVFVQCFGGMRDVHNDGVVRVFNVQVTIRSAQNDYTGGHVLALRIHDALECLGAWVGVSGQRYIDTTAAVAMPNYLGPGDNDQELFAEEFEVTAESLR